MSWYNEYLATSHWEKVRAIALYWAGYRCQVCNSGQRVEVHHRTYERIGAEFPPDLTVLCDGCHALYHGKISPVPETDPRDGPEITELKPPRKVFGYDD